jgi:hypothetical protein
VPEEIMPGRADFLVELRGFEPMAIAGVRIDKVGNFMGVPSPVYPRENPARSKGDASSSATATTPSRTMDCGPESPGE